MTLELHTFATREHFLDQASAFLYAHEVENNLLLGIVTSPLTGPEDPVLAVVQDRGQVVLAAMQTPGRNLLLSTTASKSAASFLAGRLAERAATLPGVHGPRDPARAFADAWCQRRRTTWHTDQALRIHVLHQVAAVSMPEGSFRQAAAEDLATLALWGDAFYAESRSYTSIPGREVVASAVAAGTCFVWTDPQPVAMALRMRHTRNGAVIAVVYTPPGLRRRGYATACVASLSQHLLASGFTFCSLYTDVANSTANVLYKRIGYKPVSEFGDLVFD